MTSPNIRAFLALESTAQKTLRAAFEPAGQKLVQLIAQDPKSHHHVAAALNAFDHAEALKAAAPKLKELAVSALLFGASRLKPTHQTSFMKSLPHFVLNNAVAQMTAIAGTKAKQKITMDVHRLLAKGAPVKTILKKSALFACCPPAYERVCKAADDDAYPDISDAMNAVVMGTGRALSDIAGSLTMSRLTSYGFLSEASRDGVKTYQITAILDDRTCPVCMFMEGKTFDVEQAKTRVATSLGASDPDELKHSSPWPRQDKASLGEFLSSSAEDLQAQGYDCPPFHPSCRCLLVPAGTVEETLPPAPPDNSNAVTDAINAMLNPKDRPEGFKAPLSFFSWLQDLLGGSEDTPQIDDDEIDDSLD